MAEFETATVPVSDRGETKDSANDPHNRPCRIHRQTADERQNPPRIDEKQPGNVMI